MTYEEPMRPPRDLERELAEARADSAAWQAVAKSNQATSQSHMERWARAEVVIERLREALTRIDDASNHYALTSTYSEGTLRYAHKSTRNLARAALTTDTASGVDLHAPGEKHDDD